jgi:serine protease Do
MKVAIRAAAFVLTLPILGWLWPEGAHAQKGVSPGDSRSSAQIVKLFQEVVANPSKSTVRVRCDGKDVALGTIVAEDGWIVTKFSELTGKLTCVVAGKELPAEIKGVHEPYDVAMLKIEATGLTPVVWHDSKAASVGRWVASSGSSPEPVAIGIVSVATRALKAGDQPPKMANPNSGYLGVTLDEGDGGAKIKSLSRDNPAAKAGLEVGDVVIQVGSRKTPNVEALINTVGRYKPGDVIALEVKRGKAGLGFLATLGKRPPDLLGNPQDRMGSTLSNRRGGFPLILQHDTVLKNTDCGGPLVDLDGQVVGMNIARAGRVETYAIPSEALRELLPDLRSGKLAPVPVED